MITFYSDKHLLHSGLLDPRGEGWRASSECPERASEVEKALREGGLGDLRGPDEWPVETYRSVHAIDYLDFLASAWADWVAEGHEAPNARPDTFVGPGMRLADSETVIGRLGRYSFDATTPFVAGTWDAVRASANCALTAARALLQGERHVFAACRPPGHHAAADFCGGYCYLNNSALAAQALRDGGADRVAVLDVDYHHGNGTQAIFYARDDVLTVSLHADPAWEYPYFIGYADETGQGAGAGYNVNFPLPSGTDWRRFSGVLGEALEKLRGFRPDALVVALGLDTFAGDPTTFFALESDDFSRMGEAIGGLRLPCAVVLEGGYSVEHIGRNAVNFLAGLEAK